MCIRFIKISLSCCETHDRHKTWNFLGHVHIISDSFSCRSGKLSNIVGTEIDIGRSDAEVVRFCSYYTTYLKVH